MLNPTQDFLQSLGNDSSSVPVPEYNVLSYISGTQGVRVNTATPFCASTQAYMKCERSMRP